MANASMERASFFTLMAFRLGGGEPAGVAEYGWGFKNPAAGCDGRLRRSFSAGECRVGVVVCIFAAGGDRPGVLWVAVPAGRRLTKCSRVGTAEFLSHGTSEIMLIVIAATCFASEGGPP